MNVLTTVTLALLLVAAPAVADLPATVAKVKPSVVAVGTFMALRDTQKQPRGTGFVVGGNHVVTNSHVAAAKLDDRRRETLAVYLPAPNNRIEMRAAQLVADDKEHDLAVLRFEGARLPSLTLGRASDVREGETAAFTGYPILNALGLHPATHLALIAAISPVAIPVASGKQLNPTMIQRLSAPFDVFQLDAVAYPGNSGSPLYDPDSGRVIGVINSVHVKTTKESAISAPSGISYAIPVDHVRALLRKAGVSH
jgi:S1-C subfamily serine protease